MLADLGPSGAPIPSRTPPAPDCQDKGVFREGGNRGRLRPASSEGGRNSPRQGCLGRRAGPGTRPSPRSQPPRAPLAPCFHPPDRLSVRLPRPFTTFQLPDCPRAGRRGSLPAEAFRSCSCARGGGFRPDPGAAMPALPANGCCVTHESVGSLFSPSVRLRGAMFLVSTLFPSSSFPSERRWPHRPRPHHHAPLTRGPPPPPFRAGPPDLRGGRWRRGPARPHRHPTPRGGRREGPP